MRLLLVRHAESNHSITGVIGGPLGCTGLTRRGVEQARALAARLAQTSEFGDISRLLSSPWPRAHETAAVLAASLPGRVIEDDEGLCEPLPGLADGLTWAAYCERYEPFNVQAEPDRPFAPEAETWSAFDRRVRDTLARLHQQYAGQTVIAVTHAGVIVTAFFALFGVSIYPPTRHGFLEPKHTSLTEWRVIDGQWLLERYNDVSHLDPAETVPARQPACRRALD
jgi:probable phosphoglycerate mutase